MAPHSLTEIAIVVMFALGCGLFLARLKQPPILGYIFAGVLLGPSCFSLVQSREAVTLLAELGVLMLLFLIGMELSLRVFRRIWGLAITATFLQLLGSYGIVWLCSQLFGWSQSLTFFLACVFALSSTAVAVKMLEGIGELRTTAGRITVAVLIAQDLTLVPIILVLRNMSAGIFSFMFWSKILLSVGGLVAVIWLLSRRRRLELPLAPILSHSADELIPLASLTWCFASSALAGLFGLSAAYGAFLAGLILGNTTQRHMLLQATHPIQSVLMMVFFLSVGLLLDLRFLFHNFLIVIVLLLFLTLGKTLLNALILRVLQQPWPRAFLASVVLSQIGEFAFLLATVGVESNIIHPDTQKLVIAVTVLSLALSPVWLVSARRLQALSPLQGHGFQQILTVIYGKEWQSFKRGLESTRSFVQKQWQQHRKTQTPPKFPEEK